LIEDKTNENRYEWVYEMSYEILKQLLIGCDVFIARSFLQELLKPLRDKETVLPKLSNASADIYANHEDFIYGLDLPTLALTYQWSF